MITLQAKVTSKGQVTLPKPLRSQLGIKAGDRLEFALEGRDRVSLSTRITSSVTLFRMTRPNAGRSHG